MNNTGSAVTGLDDSRAERSEKSKLFWFGESEKLQRKTTSLQTGRLVVRLWSSYFRVRISSKRSIARGSPDCPSQNIAFFRISGSLLFLAIAISAGTPSSRGR